jgi:AraC family transcriptional regulator
VEGAHRPEIERALRFIADHLDRPITVAEVARAAGMSEFHLHRVFHAEVGESIGRHITRRRLELAALRLAYEPDRSITDVALSSGYSSSSNFTKAFTGYFGCSPSRVRAPDLALPPAVGKLTELHGRTFRPADLYALPPPQGAAELAREARFWEARVRYETIAERQLACLASPGGYDFEAVMQTWQELVARAHQLGLADGPVDAWGLAHDSPDVTSPELCRYHACLPCSPDADVPSPLFRGTMLAGRYAVFPYDGPVEGVGPAYRAIYSCWFREASVAPEDFVPLDHYVGDFPADGRIALEMWFRVRPRRAG